METALGVQADRMSKEVYDFLKDKDNDYFLHELCDVTTILN